MILKKGKRKFDGDLIENNGDGKLSFKMLINLILICTTNYFKLLDKPTKKTKQYDDDDQYDNNGIYHFIFNYSSVFLLTYHYDNSAFILFFLGYTTKEVDFDI